MKLRSRLGAYSVALSDRLLLDARIVPVRLKAWESILSSYPLDGVRLAGKTVADIGCDWGQSPLYWRAHGASKVIGYESEASRVRRLKRLRREPWFEFRGRWQGDMPDADLFKMDIEGGEKDLNVGSLSKYPTWFVEIHDSRGIAKTMDHVLTDTMWMAPLFERAGGRLVRKTAHTEVWGRSKLETALVGALPG